jgi:hypothetical protein
LDLLVALHEPDRQTSTETPSVINIHARECSYVSIHSRWSIEMTAWVKHKQIRQNNCNMNKNW